MFKSCISLNMMETEKSKHQTQTSKLKSCSLTARNLQTLKFEWDKIIKYHIATCYIDRSLSQNIHNIKISAKIWRLKKAMIFLKTDKSSDVIWINSKDQRAYFIKDIENLENFLKNCIASGFNSSASVPPNLSDKKDRIVPTHLGSLRDEKGRDLVMYAINDLHFDEIPQLLEHDFDLSRKDEDDYIAIDYAAEDLNILKGSREQRIYLTIIDQLLTSNSQFPTGDLFRNCEISNNIMEFKDDMENIRINFLKGLIDSVKKTLEKYPNLSYFYDTKNQSLLAYLINLNTEYAWNLCKDYNLKIGEHEELDILSHHLGKDDEYLSKIVVLILLEKFRYITGEHLRGEHRKCVKKALELLNENKINSDILKIIAAYKRAVIFMDFDVESESFDHSGISGKQDGMTNTHGQIFIAAKGFTKSKYLHIVGIIIHEFTHLAVQLTYMNEFNPYLQGSSQKKEQFEIIFNNIKDNIEKGDQEKLIKEVFVGYTDAEQHSELIVTPMQMIIQDPERKDEIQKLYSPLFNFFEKTIVKDIKDTIPVLIRLQLENETINYQQLTSSMIAKLVHSPIYHGKDKVTYFYVFGEKKEVLKKLTSDDYKNILLKNQILNIPKKK